MQIEFNTLKCAKILSQGGLPASYAELLVESLAGVEINNLYGRVEIDTMLSETVQNAFVEGREANRKAIEECRREFDARMEERRRDFDARMAERNQQFEKDFSERKVESRNNLRWMVGTIITCTLALASYLSALIRLTH